MWIKKDILLVSYESGKIGDVNKKFFLVLCKMSDKCEQKGILVLS